MELKFTVETEDFYAGEDGPSFDNILKKSLCDAAIEKAKKTLATEQFSKISDLVSNAIVSDIKLRIGNFLENDITLTDRWGKPTFVGSVEDLLKTKIDDLLLRKVNSKGETLSGCTTQDAPTWLEWRIQKDCDDRIKLLIDQASSKIMASISKSITDQITEIANRGVKEKVGQAISNLLQQ